MKTSDAKLMGQQLDELALLLGLVLPQRLDFCREMELCHLVVDETLGIWGLSFDLLPQNLASTTHPPCVYCISCSIMEESYFPQQHD